MCVRMHILFTLSLSLSLYTSRRARASRVMEVSKRGKPTKKRDSRTVGQERSLTAWVSQRQHHLLELLTSLSDDATFSSGLPLTSNLDSSDSSEARHSTHSCLFSRFHLTSLSLHIPIFTQSSSYTGKSLQSETIRHREAEKLFDTGKPFF